MLSVFFFFLCVYSRECSAAALQGARRTPSVFVEETRWPAGLAGLQGVSGRLVQISSPPLTSLPCSTF